MLLLLDNYDSFTWNLVQRLGELDPALEVRVVRNDRITPDEAEALAPTHLLISPGPCTPKETGVCGAVVERFTGRIPVLGVCLGHQLIAERLGATVGRHHRLMHGKTSAVRHDGRGVFAGLPDPFVATRYHSLIVEETTLDDRLEVSAWTETEGGEPREIMGLRRTDVPAGAPVEGVQFHPESFLTVDGPDLLRNFLSMGGGAKPAPPADRTATA